VIVMALVRRPLVIGGAALLVAATFGSALNVAVRAQPKVRTVEIAAKKFEYMPPEITLKRGEPVNIELVAIDRIHGFSLKSLGIRADVKPDQPVVVHLVPEKTGTFVFACDIFCGDDHEDMQGVIKVVD
jgi:cytochrome c oxidase subunit 2